VASFVLPIFGLTISILVSIIGWYEASSAY